MRRSICRLERSASRNTFSLYTPALRLPSRLPTCAVHPAIYHDRVSPLLLCIFSVKDTTVSQPLLRQTHQSRDLQLSALLWNLLQRSRAGAATTPFHDVEIPQQGDRTGV